MESLDAEARGLEAALAAQEGCGITTRTEDTLGKVPRTGICSD